MANDYTEQYENLWSSPFGQDILENLKKLHDSLITDGQKADSMERGYGLLKEASGVMLAVSHLTGKGHSVVPKARRNGEE